MPWLGRTFSASFLVACEIVFQAQAQTGCIESQLRRALGVSCDLIRLLLRELWRARDKPGMRPVAQRFSYFTQPEQLIQRVSTR